MSDDPWWFSAGEEAKTRTPGASPLDLGALATGATQMVEWARALLVAPHAEHADPREHPQCLLCQAQRFIGEPASHSAPDQPGRRVIEWIEIERP